MRHMAEVYCWAFAGASETAKSKTRAPAERVEKERLLIRADLARQFLQFNGANG